MFLRVLIVIVVLAVGAGAAFLLTWDVPPPTSRIVKVIPSERFAK